MALSADQPLQLVDLEVIITSVLAVIARLVGIAVFIMLIAGGYNFLTSGGDPKKAEVAQKTITGAIIGIVIIIGGWFFLNILNEVTGVNLTCLSLSFGGCP